MQPLLSIVIANYNYGRFLEDAIQSVISQRVGDKVELIICDAASTDNSVEIIKKYANGLPPNISYYDWVENNPSSTINDQQQTINITWWCSEPDGGQSAAFNKGFSHAKGQFLTWLNADDVILPGTLKKLEVAISQNNDCEWFVGGVLWLDPEMRVVNCGRGRSFSNIRYKEGNVSVWGPSSFFTKRLLDSVGGVDERFHFTMDSDLWLRFACKANARYLPFCDYAWGLRLHPDAKMSGHDFTSNGALDVSRSVKQRIENSRHLKQIEQERILRAEYFKVRCKSRISRLLSVSWRQVLMARYDLWRWRGRKFSEVFHGNCRERSVKIAFISSHPAPYRDGFLHALANSNEVDATIYTEFLKDKWHSFWGLDAPPYPMNLINNGNESRLHLFFKNMRLFVSNKYDCVCWNGLPPRLHMIIPLLISALMHKCYGIYADTITERRKNWVVFLIKKFIITKSSFIFVPGKASLEYFSSVYGIQKRRICIGAYALEGKILEDAICRLQERRQQIREEYGIAEHDRVFLMVANMLQKRQYPITTSAFLKVAKRHSNIRYVIVGIGDDLDAMQKLSVEHNEIVVVPGCPFEKIKELYAMADVYVHGGYEPASTALVLGGIAHKPIISSYAVGCAKDILEDGVSGILVHDHNSESDWAVAFEKMLDCQDSWKEMGEASHLLSKELDVDVTVNRFVGVVRKYCDVK